MDMMTSGTRTPDQRAVDYQKEIPDVYQALIGVHGAIDGHGGLEPKLRHLVLLRASQINRCAFCVKMHTREAKQDGETAERLERVIVWEHVSDFSAAERAALAWTEALTVLDQRIDLGPLRAGLRAHFGEREIADLTATIGMINLWNRLQVANY